MHGRETMVGCYANRLHYVGIVSAPGQFWSLCGTVSGRTVGSDAIRRSERGMRKVEYARLPFCKLCEREALPR